jgi:hypothetical protein
MNRICTDPFDDLDQVDASTISEFFREHLKQVVRLHTAMFEKLLFEDKDMPIQLAELFEDAGNTYLDISESISRHLFIRRFLKVE